MPVGQKSGFWGLKMTWKCNFLLFNLPDYVSSHLSRLRPSPKTFVTCSNIIKLIFDLIGPVNLKKKPHEANRSQCESRSVGVKVKQKFVSGQGDHLTWRLLIAHPSLFTFCKKLVKSQFAVFSGNKNICFVLDLFAFLRMCLKLHLFV